MLTLGLMVRYVATPQEWNARSSNLFARKSLATGSYLFHYTIIFVFFGHVIGLLIPEPVLAAFGFTPHVHAAVASFCGKIFAPCLFAGAAILLWRRCADKNVWASTRCMDVVVLICLLLQALTGGCQDFMGDPAVITPIGVWVRNVLCCIPMPDIMLDMPLRVKAHIVVGFAIFAMIPFSRLVHFFSIPLTWFAKPLISYRRRYENL